MRNDTKGRPLVIGAWYALYDDGGDIWSAPLGQWDGSNFIDESGEPIYNLETWPIPSGYDNAARQGGE